MFLLTREKDNLTSGAYASVDVDGLTVIQFFKNKDDAEFYKTQLEALDHQLHVSQLPDDQVDIMCDSLGYAYSIVEPGEIVYPKLETMQFTLAQMLGLR
ncbi:hypothetical cyanophage protein [Synechococcus phage S-CRM01]|uniref:hypothetical cyanophage protein n=1 Tax=Synechococcus phage S-CRM01 TaxID=1026955 RepID=UPI000209E35F|nr:hypothetical cyanophage protein [Synechococcus phage S-CRM01]AEC53000.1 hypothetical cyanophage protein [Synechococcus phage S-CRM01]